MTIDPQLLETIVEDFEAEAAYAHMLASPESVVSAFDLFDDTIVIAQPLPETAADDTIVVDQVAPAFDQCDRSLHFAYCADQTCRRQHWLDGMLERVHNLGKCPNEGETWDGALRACEPPKTEA